MCRSDTVSEAVGKEMYLKEEKRPHGKWKWHVMSGQEGHVENVKDCEVEGKLLEVVKSFYRNIRACVKIRQVCCVTMAVLYCIYMNSVMQVREMKTILETAKLETGGKVLICLYVIDTCLLKVNRITENGN